MTQIKATSKKELTATPVEIPPRVQTIPFEPEFLRLPKPGQLCPRCGMSRSALNMLILPCQQNSFKAPVRSFVLRQRGAKTGIRLIDWQSLRAYIRAHEEGKAA
jgi:hypothetical protein